ncbi:hypothetical protein [Bergeyella sp. RCAD1439]|uniref:hypothetical protein n=1 Tax=Bergeyella anatis TaxID=3113737 RepID=UPI002E17F6AF|nr:hypothetical protein [Bergeyella sp. RCAD1439]
MKATIKIIMAVIVMFCISCSTMKYNIQKNNKQIDKIISSLLEKNGNVFYLTSTYATFSTVWTYHKGRLEIYKLVNGKIILQQEYFTTSIDNINQISKEELFELDQCIELDGDGFGYRIKKGSGIEQQDLPIGIECFIKLKYKSEFLNKVIKDINTYKMWDV